MSKMGPTIPLEVLEGRVAAWLESEPGVEFPDWLLTSVFEVTRHEPQQRRLGQRLARLAGWLARGPGTAGGRRTDRLSALRVVTAAVFVVAIGIGAMLGIRASFRSTPVTAPGTQADVAQATGLLEVTLDADAIPEDLAGVLFFRKVYPTDHDVAYGRGFVPPNTFARYVESGELAIRPRSEVQVIRAGTTWAEAETVEAGEEAVVGPGDAFVMQDIPFDAYGSEALGTMTTPGDDARVVGFAIRESSRCCSMTHAGMQSPWYHTLLQGVQELRGAPVSLRIARWDVPAGADLPPVDDGALTLRAVDAGIISGVITPAGPAATGVEPGTLTFGAGSAIALPRILKDGDTVRLLNAGPDTAVVYQLTVEPDPSAVTAPAGTLATVSESGPMLSARSGHSATLLDDGRVLISGGGCAEVEVYDPETGTSEPAGEMSSIRNATATLLEDGRVLLAGGSEDPAELFDPRSGSVAAIGPMVEVRHFQSAIRLHDGRVLVTGGETDTAEFFDPDTEAFAPTGSMSTSRARHTSVLLWDTRVLVAGGGTPVVELYDADTGRFTPSEADGLQAFDRGTATRLADGRVLLIGHGASPAVYDPATDSVATPGPMVTPRYDHAAVLLNDGRVLLVGGLASETLAATASIEVFDPRMLTFEEVGSLGMARWQPAATRLCDGRVLVTGGTGGTAPTVSAELIAVGTIR